MLYGKKSRRVNLSVFPWNFPGKQNTIELHYVTEVPSRSDVTLIYNHLRMFSKTFALNFDVREEAPDDGAWKRLHTAFFI